MTSTNTSIRAARAIFPGADNLTDNVALLEWLETVRRLIHSGAVELGVTASDVEARLRSVSGGMTVASWPGRRRAAHVAGPIRLAGEALVVASQYAVTAASRFEATYMPELEQAGWAGGGRRARGFEFRGAA